jgi:hypothetical protein
MSRKYAAIAERLAQLQIVISLAAAFAVRRYAAEPPKSRRQIFEVAAIFFALSLD